MVDARHLKCLDDSRAGSSPAALTTLDFGDQARRFYWHTVPNERHSGTQMLTKLLNIKSLFLGIRLKIRRGYPRAGSSPAARTNWLSRNSMKIDKIGSLGRVWAPVEVLV